MISEREHARLFQGMTLDANRICVEAGKKAELGKDSLVLAEGTVALVGTGGIGSSDALIGQGSQVTAGRLWLTAHTEARIAKDAVIEAAHVLIHATGDLGATHAQLRQGVQLWAGEMSMLSENDASIDKNVSVTVEGHFEMEAAGRCRIHNRATIVAGSTSGNCFE